jgi:hypothetical protein
MATFTPPRVAAPVPGVPHPNEYGMIDGIVAAYCDWRNNINDPSVTWRREVLDNKLYEYYTSNFLLAPYIDDLKYSSDPSTRAWIDGFRQKFNVVGNSVIQEGRDLGFDVFTNTGWLFFNKKAKLISNKTYYKFYLTITDGWNLDKLLKNMERLKNLIGLIHSMNNNGYVSMKIAVPLYALLGHKDTVVIHFSDESDAKGLWAAVQSSGLDLYPRDNLHRLDWGFDMHGSDTQLVVENFPNVIQSTRAIRSSICPPHTLSSDERQNVFDALRYNNYSAPHRQHVNLQHK